MPRGGTMPRLLMPMLGLAAASTTLVPELPPALSAELEVNETAAAIAVGNIVAQAAEASGATDSQVIQQSANAAGSFAAQDARAEGKTETQVAAAATGAAEAAAAEAGATVDEAAEAAAATAVNVANEAKTTSIPFHTDAFNIVQGTQCLSWWGDGCNAITTQENCLGSRDGSDIAVKDGVKVFAEPCVWCGGHACSATEVAVCAPKTMISDMAGFESATCSGNDESSLTSATEWKQTVPEALEQGGFAHRDLNFEPMWNVGEGKEEKEGGHACRAKTVNDASNPNPSARNYYSTWTAATLEECFDICSWKQDCTGVEHSVQHAYCEVWTTPIQWTSPLPGYTCYSAVAKTVKKNVAGAVQWRENDILAAQGTEQTTSLPTIYWILAAVILAGIAVLICIVWRSKSKKKLKGKRAAKLGASGNEGGGSADEMQPLVGAAVDSLAPSFAGSFSMARPQLGNYYQTPSFPPASGRYAYEPLGTQQVQQAAVGPDNDYLQQLRSWLQQYEAARFQELTQLQANSQA
ncbi:unnamed protein product, partial [Effrenium voratum]